MSTISKINVNGTTYEIADDYARELAGTKQDSLTAGAGITINNGTISCNISNVITNDLENGQNISASDIAAAIDYVKRVAGGIRGQVGLDY